MITTFISAVASDFLRVSGTPKDTVVVTPLPTKGEMVNVAETHNVFIIHNLVTASFK